MGNKHPGVLLSKNLLADRWGKGKGGVGHQVDDYIHTAHSCQLNIQEVAFSGTGVQYCVLSEVNTNMPVGVECTYGRRSFLA